VIPIADSFVFDGSTDLVNLAPSAVVGEKELAGSSINLSNHLIDGMAGGKAISFVSGDQNYFEAPDSDLYDSDQEDFSIFLCVIVLPIADSWIPSGSD